MIQRDNLSFSGGVEPHGNIRTVYEARPMAMLQGSFWGSGRPTQTVHHGLVVVKPGKMIVVRIPSCFFQAQAVRFNHRCGFARIYNVVTQDRLVWESNEVNLVIARLFHSLHERCLVDAWPEGKVVLQVIQELHPGIVVVNESQYSLDISNNYGGNRW